MRFLISLALVLLGSDTFAFDETDYQKAFEGRDSCFLAVDIRSGKTLAQHNPDRCSRRFWPCSTFKVPLAAMAFDRGVLADDTTVIRWDGVKRNRPELNQDQTARSWLVNSVVWVSQWVTPRLGRAAIDAYLAAFQYGNRDFSGGLDRAWIESSLTISANEQIDFLRNLWNGKLPISKHAVEMTKRVSYLGALGAKTSLWGKTGTCCLDAACEHGPGRQLGWFVGVVDDGARAVAFAANASDVTTVTRGFAGPRTRAAVEALLGRLGLSR